MPSFTTQSYSSPKKTFNLLSNLENSTGHSFQFMYLDSLLHHEVGKDMRFLLTSKAAVAAVQPSDEAYRVFLHDSTPLI